MRKHLARARDVHFVSRGSTRPQPVPLSADWVPKTQVACFQKFIFSVEETGAETFTNYSRTRRRVVSFGVTFHANAGADLPPKAAWLPGTGRDPARVATSSLSSPKQRDGN